MMVPTFPRRCGVFITIQNDRIHRSATNHQHRNPSSTCTKA